MSKFLKTGFVFLAGAAIGAIAGILLAPDKGSETRKKMADKAKDWGDAVKEKAQKGFEEVNNMKENFVKKSEERFS